LKVAAVVTVPPYASFLDEVARHPLVSGLRLNTVMPIKGTPHDTLRRLSGYGVPLWVDLKGRQLRVVGAAIPPFTEVRVSHPVTVDTPADCFFDDGREYGRIVAVDGDRLILEDTPRRFVGPGESLNVVHPSLRVHGTLTDTDKGYLSAMGELGLTRVMLSYCEEATDVDEVKSILPGAEVVLKIESVRGLDLALRQGDRQGRLMAARGDLYVEVVEPHRIVRALRTVLRADPQAWVASRLFPSLARGAVPEAQDIGDAAWLLSLGYRTFMLGDEVCLRRDSVMAALNLLEQVAEAAG
jgi:pyruvate kinase